MSGIYSFAITLNDLVSNKLTQISGRLNSLQAKVTKSQTNIQKKFDKTTSSIGFLQKKLDSLNEQRTASTSINSIRQLNGEIRKTEREINKLKNLPPLSFTERLRGIGGQFSGMIGLAGGVALAMKAWDGVKALFNKGVELEQTKIKFDVLLGSAEKSKKMLADLNGYANFTPYSNNSIIKSAETMLAFGVAEDKVMDNMKMLGDVAMGNEQKMDSLSLVYSQIMSTGRLMGQDLLQLINQGFNPLQIISENTGISMGKLKKKMEQGAISATMIEEAFRLATSEGGRYYGMTEKMKESAGGKWSTFIGALSFSLSQIGEKLAKMMIPLIEIGITVAENIVPFAAGIADIFRWVSECEPLLVAFTGVVAALGVQFLYVKGIMIATEIVQKVLSVSTMLLTKATALWNFVLSLNPISLVIIAIVALVAVVVMLWNKFDWFRGGIMGVWETLKGFGMMIKNYVINRFKELLSGVVGIGKALVAFFKGDWRKAWEVGKKAGADLLGKNSATQAIEDGKNAIKGFQKGYEKGVKMKPLEFNLLKKNTPFAAGSSEENFEKQQSSKLFESLDGDNKINNGATVIAGGGAKQTHINITIQKLQDDTKIYVSNAEHGIEDLGDKVQEILLRAINSVNQMQTT